MRSLKDQALISEQQLDAIQRQFAEAALQLETARERLRSASKGADHGRQRRGKRRTLADQKLLRLSRLSRFDTNRVSPQSSQNTRGFLPAFCGLCGEIFF